MISNELKKEIGDFIRSTSSLSTALMTLQDGEQLSEDKKVRAAYALNMCTVSVSQIVDYKDVIVLEQEYEAILNNLNLEKMPKDEALLHLLKQLLDTITYFRIDEGDKAMVEKEYQEKMKNNIWKAVPQFGMVIASGDPLAMAVSLASQIGIGYMNYRRGKAEANLEKESKMWQLQRSAIDQLNGLRRELFDTAWRLADKYGFEDKYRLTERQIKQYNTILMDPDELRRYERLASIMDKFEAYPPFWYFIGNAAHLISDDISLSKETRKEYRKKALAFFEKYERINRLSVLREDQLAASCALEHVDLILLEKDYNRSKVMELITRAVEKSGNANDVLELCAIAYLKINEQNKAEEILRILVNEDYNRIVNAQLLSAIYVHHRKHSDYELLSKRVGTEYLFPMPVDERADVKLLEAEFGSRQKEVLRQKYKIAFIDYLEKFTIRWNRLISVFDSSKEYDDSFFVDTSKAAARRLEEAQRVFSNQSQKEHYLLWLANSSYELTIISILNDFCTGITSITQLSDGLFREELYAGIRENVTTRKDQINELQGAIDSGEFGIQAYQLASKICFKDIVSSAYQRAKAIVDTSIDKATVNDIPFMESELRSFCLKQGIKEPEISISTSGFDYADVIEDSFGPELFGHKAIVAKKNAEYLKEMANYVRSKMSSIPLKSNDAALYFRDDSEFLGFFYSATFEKHADLKSHAIMIIKDHTGKSYDLVFTTHGIVIISNSKVRHGLTPYCEVKLKKNALVFYPHREYKTSALDLNLLYGLIRDLGNKFVHSIEDHVEQVEGIVTASMLNQWFRERPDAMKDGIGRVNAIPKKAFLEHSGYYFSDEVDPNSHILQYYYDKKSGDILGMRIVKYDTIESNFQALLREKDGVMRVGK